MSEREWVFYLQDMVNFANNVLLYKEDLNQSEFESTGLNYDATVRNLELIGEAATHIPESIRQEYSNIPWRMIIATRNQLIHGYLGLDNDILWNIINDDIPELLLELEKVIT
ncbi:MAG: DUF86 domain-containing protein [Gammaproteobacteria bacterium]|nr:DUF86 domain-containing protein [Gammaproteobacteria bacterium]